VRELKNMVERLLITCIGETVDSADLPEELSLVKILNTGEISWDENVSLPELKSILVTRLEKDYLINALRDTNGCVVDAAKKSGISRKTFHLLMKKYGLKRR